LDYFVLEWRCLPQWFFNRLVNFGSRNQPPPTRLDLQQPAA
jgi:hypothetical protein